MTSTHTCAVFREQIATGMTLLSRHCEDVTGLEALVPAAVVAGTRYDEHQMRILDSEK